MVSINLLNPWREFRQKCKDRLVLGAKVYGESGYLGRDLSDQIQEMQDEIIDQANYAFMNWHKLELMKEKIKKLKIDKS